MVCRLENGENSPVATKRAFGSGTMSSRSISNTPRSAVTLTSLGLATAAAAVDENGLA